MLSTTFCRQSADAHPRVQMTHHSNLEHNSLIEVTRQVRRNEVVNTVRAVTQRELHDRRKVHQKHRCYCRCNKLQSTRSTLKLFGAKSSARFLHSCVNVVTNSR